MKTLRQAKIGETVQVVKLHGEGAVKRRIMDMGITRGVEVFVRKTGAAGRSHGGYGAGLRAVPAEGRRRNDPDRVKALQAAPYLPGIS